MAESNTTPSVDLKPNEIDFATYRLSGSNCLSDEIALPLSGALTLISRMYETTPPSDNLLPLIENAINDASHKLSRDALRPVVLRMHPPFIATNLILALCVSTVAIECQILR